MLKYEFTGATNPLNPTLHQIRALRGFGSVKRGDLDEFEAMVLSDRWVEADEDTRNRCRPELVALIAFVRARVATWA